MTREQSKGIQRSAEGNGRMAGAKKNAAGARLNAAEAESLRRQMLTEAGRVDEAPGQMDALLDRAYLADSFFEEHVLQDPACLRSPELFRQAWAVAQALADFYQRVGQELAKEPTGQEAAGDAAGAGR